MLLNEYVRPKDLHEAYELLLEDKNNIIIGGGAWLKLTHKEVHQVIDLSSIGLHEIIDKGDFIEIGAMTSLRQIETSKVIQQYYDGIVTKAVKSIMGMNIRNLATIGGSIMGRYSFSDIFTPLLAVDVSLVFFNSGEISLEDFMKNRKMERDILVKIILHKKQGRGYFYNMKKTHLDFAVINVAVTKAETIKIVVGARPSISLRAFKAEEYINSTEINEESILHAALLAKEEIKVSSNARASKEYRSELIEVYVKRGLKEVLDYEG
jgi:CO/xanthine dehydrogenase FAD-binding subunit